jgi:hypothetical protein
MPSPVLSQALVLAPILLAPVVALLFLNLRLSRRLRYPHNLLEPEARKGPASFLFRSFRTYYDFLLDAALAIILAFALARALAPAGEEGPAAVVVDCSRSMLAGQRGSRPLDQALKRLSSEASLKKAVPFALAFDPREGRSALVPISAIVAGAEPARAATRLEDELAFFAVDYGVIAELRLRGFGPVTLLSDHVGRRAEGLGIVESGFAVSFGAFPSAARFDRIADSWLVALVEAGGRGPIRVSAWRQGDGAFSPVGRDRYEIEEAADGRSIRFSAPGLYLISLTAPEGQRDVDIPLRLERKTIQAAARGRFSERMLEAFPLVEKSIHPELVLADLGSGLGSIEPAWSAARKSPIVTALTKADGPYVINPALTEGRPVAAALVPGADFALGPNGLANEDLVLAYDAALLAAAVPPFAVPPLPGRGRLVPAGSAYVAFGPFGPLPLVAPAEEFFETRFDAAVVLPPTRKAAWPWALALAAIAAAKLALWRRISGKSLVRAD